MEIRIGSQIQLLGFWAGFGKIQNIFYRSSHVIIIAWVQRRSSSCQRTDTGSQIKSLDLRAGFGQSTDGHWIGEIFLLKSQLNVSAYSIQSCDVLSASFQRTNGEWFAHNFSCVSTMLSIKKQLIEATSISYNNNKVKQKWCQCNVDWWREEIRTIVRDELTIEENGLAKSVVQLFSLATST